MSFQPRRAVIRGTSAVIRGLYRMMGGFRVSGLENVPATGAAILASNHLSWADPPAIRAVIRRTCWFMANDFLLRIPLLGKLLPIYGAFPVRRGMLDRAALRAAEGFLKQGDLVCIFPEGGTTITGTLYPFEGGVALLALKAGVPVIPVALAGTDRLLPPAKPWPHYARGGVSVTIGKAICPSEVDPQLPHRERIDALTERIQRAVAAMLPPEYLPSVDQAQRDTDVTDALGTEGA